MSEDSIQAIYREIGYSDIEVEGKLNDVYVQLDAYVSGMFDEYSAKVEQFQQEVIQGKEEIQTIASRFGIEACSFEDIENLKLVPQHKELTTRLSRFQQQQQEREHAITEQLTVISSISNALGEPECISTEIGFDLSNERLEKLQVLQRDMHERMDTRKQELQQVGNELHDIIIDLDLQPEEQQDIDILLFNALNSEQGILQMGFHIDIYHALAKRKDIALEMRDERSKKLQDLAQEISKLWNLLGVEQSIRLDFLTKHSGLSLPTIQACENLLNDLNLKKIEALPVLIDNAKCIFNKICDEMRLGPCEVDEYQMLLNAETSEHTLELLLKQNQELEKKAELMRPILLLVDKRDDFLEQIKEYEASLTDPNRFKIPGRMLQEEKIRKRIHMKYPRVIEKIETSILQYEEEYGTFEVGGKDYLKQMKAEETLRKEREMQKKDGLRQAIRVVNSHTAATPIRSNSTNENSSVSTLPRKRALPSTLKKNKTLESAATPKKRTVFSPRSENKRLVF